MSQRVDNEPAYVLHTHPWRETSLIVEAFTARHGRVGLVARGARRAHAALRTRLLAFQPLALSWHGKGGLKTLRAAEWLGGAPYLSGRALICGFYVNELILKLLAPEDPHAGLFRSYDQALHALAGAPDPQPVLRRFELELLSELGYAQTLDRTADGCPVRPDSHYGYVIGRGVVAAGEAQPSLSGKSLLDMSAGDYSAPSSTTIWGTSPCTPVNSCETCRPCEAGGGAEGHHRDCPSANGRGAGSHVTSGLSRGTASPHPQPPTVNHQPSRSFAMPDTAIIGLVSISDRAASGVYEDKGIPALREWLQAALINPLQFIERLIPDEQPLIEATLMELADRAGCCLVLTTGGTGPAPRDVTPEATLAVAHKVLPGFGEAMRAVSLKYVPTAILSRQVGVTRGACLILNLPGQPKAIKETLDGVFAAVPYCVDLIGGPYLETRPELVQAFRPKSAQRPAPSD